MVTKNYGRIKQFSKGTKKKKKKKKKKSKNKLNYRI
jgi:hypothetical protein